MSSDGGGLRVLVTDPLISRLAARLRAGAPEAHWDFESEPGGPVHDDAWLADALARADVVVCSRLDAVQAGRAGVARLVQVTGVGLDRVAVDAVRPAAAIANTAHHERSIAEHVLMSVLLLSRGVLAAHDRLRSGEWRSAGTDPAYPFHRTLDQLHLGLYGLGGIGSATALLAHRCGMAFSAVRSRPAAPLPEELTEAGATPEFIGGRAELVPLAERSDVLVVTAPLTEGTRGSVDAKVLRALGPDGLLINVARGPLVDEAALHHALRAGELGGAALDVWWGAPEPGRTPPADHDFASLDNVLLTPHFSGHALSTFEARVDDISANVRALSEGSPLRRVVRVAQ